MPAAVARFSWAAQPRQDDFLTADEDVVLYGGAAGGGKTDALLIHGLLVCHYHPGANVLFLRREYTQLNEPGAAISRAHEIFPQFTGEWHQQDRRWSFRNGSTFQFGNLQYSHSIYSYQGAQIDCLLFDELTQFEEGQFDYLCARVRATVPHIRTTVRAATNPGGIGHGWVKRRFIDSARWGEPFDWTNDDGKVIGRARFIPARLEDNPALTQRDPTYVDKLSQLPPELRRALRDGDWDLFLGQFFTEWRRQLHVCDPFPIPVGWPRWRSVDWGYGKPYCCLWFARSPDRRIYVYRELYASGVLDVDQARIISKLSAGEVIRTTYADPSMWNSQANGQSVAAVYARNGVSVTKANNDRNAGWQRVHEALQGEQPQLQVFSTCLNLIRTLPLLIHDSIDVEDCDTDGEDHACLPTLTYISMVEGKRLICDVRVGDRIRTPTGLRRVLAWSLTDPTAQLWTVRTNIGPLFEATGNHPVYVKGRGFIRVDALRYGDILALEDEQCELNPSSSTESRFGAILTRATGRTATTIARAATTGSRALGRSIRRFGRRTTDLSRRAITSITRMVTRRTTSPRTSSPSLFTSISPATGDLLPTLHDYNWSGLDPLPQSGIDPKPAASGTAPTPSGFGPSISPPIIDARNVAQLSNRASLTGSASAPTPASLATDVMRAATMNNGPALFVVELFRSTDMSPPGPALGIAVSVIDVKPSRREPVYNLAVEGGQYYANGVLVHNCDALRYGLIGGVPAVPTKTPYSLARMRPQDNRHWAERSNGVAVK